MSHDRRPLDHIELQRYFSENGSVVSAPNGNMSASGSFTGSAAPSSAVPHTDADNEQNPTYFSIPEAQNEHQQYKAAQPSSVPVSFPTPSVSEGTETPYDFIPDSKHNKGMYPTGVTMHVADNILYEQATTENLHHQTLTMDKQQQYKGSLTPDPLEYHKDGVECCRGVSCRKVCQACLVLTLVLVVLVALAAGVLSLAIIFTGFVDTCGKCNEVNADDAALVLLRAEVQLLEMRLQALEPETTMDTPKTTPMSMDSSTVSMTSSATTVAMTTPTSPSPFMEEGMVSLSGVNLFQNCTTSVEATCNIPPGDDTGNCFTSPDVLLNTPGEYVLNMNCVRAAESAEPNPLIGTLDIFQNAAVCLCYVPDLDPVGQRLFDVMCGLQVTRCVNPTNITASLTADEL